METEEDVVLDSSPEEVVEEAKTPVDISEDVKTPTNSAPKTEEKVVPYERFKQVNDELARLKKQPPKVVDKSLDVDDYIEISTSLEGLDSRERAYLARQHKLTGQPISELRKDEDFSLWQTAYKDKLEKERALSPSTVQADEERPKSLADRLASASVADKERILIEAGLMKDPTPTFKRQKIDVTK